MTSFELPIKNVETVDVAVVGGGTAGCFAAIAAARTGSSTMLIEKNGVLGGTITTAGVNFPGLFFAWGKQIIDGPCWEAIKKIEALGGATIPSISRKPAKHWHEQILVNRFLYTVALDELCLDAGVRVRLHTMLSHGVETEDGIRLFITGKEGMTCIHAKTVIDATGDANLTTALGYPCVQSEVLQPATLINDLSGYDVNDIDEENVIQSAKVAIESGALPSELNPQNLLHSLLQHRITFHLHCEEAATSAGKTKVEIESRKKLMKIYEFLRGLPNMEDLYISFVADECGIRETKRIIGEKTVTEHDYLTGVMQSDAICYAFYPIDLHVMDGIEQVFLEEGKVPSIPYGALIPQGSQRLLVAGRCISSDTGANSALRVQAPCMATGQAAGCAASIAANKKLPVNTVPYEELSDALIKLGAIVPDQKDCF